MTKTYKYWTEEQDALVLELRAEGYRAAEIADHMGRTKSSINNRLAMMKARGPRLSVSKPAARSRLDKILSALGWRKS